MTKDDVKAILQNPLKYKWSVQGLGMMRTYISKTKRLHIWDDTYEVLNVSALHTHPWDFTSTVIAGVVLQHRYTLVSSVVPFAVGRNVGEYNMVKIKCGAGACTLSPVERVLLRQEPLETYVSGKTYAEKGDEIHHSFPLKGTVTLVDRTVTDDGFTASVFWPGIGGFVSAEPRDATEEEVLNTTKNSLDAWF